MVLINFYTIDFKGKSFIPSSLTIRCILHIFSFEKGGKMKSKVFIYLVVLITLLFQLPAQAQNIVSAWYEYRTKGTGTTIEILVPVINGLWKLNNQCKAAGKALKEALKSQELQWEPGLICTGKKADVVLDKNLKDRLGRLLPLKRK